MFVHVLFFCIFAVEEHIMSHSLTTTEHSNNYFFAGLSLKNCFKERLHVCQNKQKNFTV